MKTVLFTEEQLQDPDAIAKQLFYDELDPRSLSYVRKLKRPEIKWFRIFFCLFAPVSFAIVLAALLRYYGFTLLVSVAVPSAVLLLYIVLMLKRAVVCIIKIYQRYAPDRIRNKCRFEPSCSEYMILVIEKYGLIKGSRKGIQRLRRCNINGGGFDFPV